MGRLADVRRELQVTLQRLTQQVRFLPNVDPVHRTKLFSEIFKIFNKIIERLESAIWEAEQAEIAAREAQAKFEMIFNASPDATAITRSYDSVVVTCNESFLQLLGYTQEEVVGNSMLASSFYVNPADREKILQRLYTDGHCENVEVPFRTKAGQQLLGAISAKFIMLHNTPHIMSITRDVTESKRTEQLLQQSEQRYRELVESSKDRIGVSDVIKIISQTMYANNAREAQHSQRVGALCEQIGIALQLSSVELGKLRAAGIMHDIGKVSISSELLEKQEPLTPAEWREIKRHTESGYHILNSVPAFNEIAKVILAHHEHWDGRGYPRGMRGEEIPLKARIIAVAEAYTAMTEPSSYRTPLSRAEALAELRKKAGTQFDTRIVSMFIDHVVTRGESA